MKTFKIKAQIREELGTSAVKKYRREGFIPGVAYGKGEKTLHLLIPEKEIQKLLRQMGDETSIIEIEYDGTSKKAFLQEVQRDVVSGRIIHLDFHIIHEKEKVSVSVPIIVKGQENSPGLKKGGILEVHLHSIDIRAYPEDVPGHFEVDISNLDIGQSIHVKDIKIENVEFEENLDEVILSILAPRVEEQVQQVEQTSQGEQTQA